MEIKKCTPADYPALLDVFNDAFGYGRADEWFQKEMPHCTPYPALVTKEEIEHHWLCIIDGHIAGGLGAYPVDWIVSNSKGEKHTISAYGIGQVCCLPEFRNQGVMTVLLNASEADMRKQGRAVGFLHGNRRRYGYFGYDFGGHTVKYHMDYKLLESVASQGTTIRQAILADWAEINDVYETQPSYIKRCARSWKLQFARIGLKWFVGECDGRKGYMCVQSNNDICEIYGDPGVLAAMILDRAGSLEDVNSLCVIHAAENVISTPQGQMLYSTAASVESQPKGLFVILDAAKILTELEIDHTNMPLATKESIARQLLNFSPLPEKRPYIQPLCAWISAVDSI